MTPDGSRTLRRSAETDRPALLLISYHFPPGRGAGAVRWERMSDYAAEIGWALEVVTALRPDAPRGEDGTLDQLPDAIGVHGIPDDPLALDRLEDRLWRWKQRFVSSRGGAAKSHGGVGAVEATDPADEAESPSPGLSERAKKAYYAWREYARTGDWARRAAALARTIRPSSGFAAVITSGPPHMAHEAGRRVARRERIPLILDMRDPWSLVQRLPGHISSPLWYRLAARHERRCVRAASLIAMNTEPAAEAMARRYPALRDRVTVVRNGSDEPVSPASPRPDRFIVGYAGTIYLDRDPGPLFRAAAIFVERHGLTPADFTLEFMGDVKRYRGRDLQDVARMSGLDPSFVTVHPPGSREDALAFLATCSVVVNLPQDSSLAIPSKVYEYATMKSRLLAFETPESATGRVLAEVNAWMVPPGDVEGALACLEAAREDREAGREPEPVDPGGLLSRRVQAERFYRRVAEVVRADRGASHSLSAVPEPAEFTAAS